MAMRAPADRQKARNQRKKDRKKKKKETKKKLQEMEVERAKAVHASQTSEEDKRPSQMLPEAALRAAGVEAEEKGQQPSAQTLARPRDTRSRDSVSVAELAGGDDILRPSLEEKTVDHSNLPQPPTPARPPSSLRSFQSLSGDIAGPVSLAADNSEDLVKNVLAALNSAGKNEVQVRASWAMKGSGDNFVREVAVLFGTTIVPEIHLTEHSIDCPRASATSIWIEYRLETGLQSRGAHTLTLSIKPLDLGLVALRVHRSKKKQSQKRMTIPKEDEKREQSDAQKPGKGQVPTTSRDYRREEEEEEKRRIPDGSCVGGIRNSVSTTVFQFSEWLSAAARCANVDWNQAYASQNAWAGVSFSNEQKQAGVIVGEEGPTRDFKMLRGHQRNKEESLASRIVRYAPAFLRAHAHFSLLFGVDDGGVVLGEHYTETTLTRFEKGEAETVSAALQQVMFPPLEKNCISLRVFRVNTTPEVSSEPKEVSYSHVFERLRELKGRAQLACDGPRDEDCKAKKHLIVSSEDARHTEPRFVTEVEFRIDKSLRALLVEGEHETYALRGETVVLLSSFDIFQRVQLPSDLSLREALFTPMASILVVSSEKELPPFLSSDAIQIEEHICLAENPSAEAGRELFWPVAVLVFPEANVASFWSHAHKFLMARKVSWIVIVWPAGRASFARLSGTIRSAVDGGFNVRGVLSSLWDPRPLRDAVSIAVRASAPKLHVLHRHGCRTLKGVGEGGASQLAREVARKWFCQGSMNAEALEVVRRVLSEQLPVAFPIMRRQAKVIADRILALLSRAEPEAQGFKPKEITIVKLVPSSGVSTLLSLVASLLREKEVEVLSVPPDDERRRPYSPPAGERNMVEGKEAKLWDDLITVARSSLPICVLFDDTARSPLRSDASIPSFHVPVVFVAVHRGLNPPRNHDALVASPFLEREEVQPLSLALSALFPEKKDAIEEAAKQARSLGTYQARHVFSFIFPVVTGISLPVYNFIENVWKELSPVVRTALLGLSFMSAFVVSVNKVPNPVVDYGFSFNLVLRRTLIQNDGVDLLDPTRKDLPRIWNRVIAFHVFACASRQTGKPVPDVILQCLKDLLRFIGERASKEIFFGFLQEVLVTRRGAPFSNLIGNLWKSMGSKKTISAIEATLNDGLKTQSSRRACDEFYVHWSIVKARLLDNDGHREDAISVAEEADTLAESLRASSAPLAQHLVASYRSKKALSDKDFNLFRKAMQSLLELHPHHMKSWDEQIGPQIRRYLAEARQIDAWRVHRQEIDEIDEKVKSGVAEDGKEERVPMDGEYRDNLDDEDSLHRFRNQANELAEEREWWKAPEWDVLMYKGTRHRTFSSRVAGRAIYPTKLTEKRRQR